jgi:hypothetical protein
MPGDLRWFQWKQSADQAVCDVPVGAIPLCLPAISYRS